MHNHEQTKKFSRLLEFSIHYITLIMKCVSCERFIINMYRLFFNQPHLMLVIALLSVSSYSMNVFAFQHHIPRSELTRRRVWKHDNQNPSYYYHKTAPYQLRIVRREIGALQVVKRDTKEIDSSDLLRKYKTRSSILEHEIRSNVKELSTQKSKVIILQEVVQKMKVNNSALVEKLASLKNGTNPTKILLSKKYSNRKISRKEEEMEIVMKQQQIDLERNERNMREIQEHLRKEEKKRISISVRCEEMTEELNSVLEKHQIEIENYRKKSDENQMKRSEMQTQIFNQNMEISRFQEVAGNNNNNIDHLEKQKLKEECYRLGGQMKSLELQCASYKMQARNQRKIYGNLRNETNVLLEEEIIKSSDFQTKIARLQNDKLGAEIALNTTRNDMEKLQKRLKKNEIQKTLGNERKNKEDILSKEAMLIATAAVQQSEEREQELKHKLGVIQLQLEDLSNQRDHLQKDMEESRKMHKEELMKTERRHRQQILKREEIQDDIKEKHTLLKSQHEQTKLSFEREQLLDRAHWEKKLLKMENVYDGVVENLKQEIVDLTRKESADSEIEGQLSIIEDSDNKVRSKHKSLGAVWCKIWFRKSRE